MKKAVAALISKRAPLHAREQESHLNVFLSLNLERWINELFSWPWVHVRLVMQVCWDFKSWLPTGCDWLTTQSIMILRNFNAYYTKLLRIEGLRIVTAPFNIMILEEQWSLQPRPTSIMIMKHEGFQLNGSRTGSNWLFSPNPSPMKRETSSSSPTRLHEGLRQAK